MFTGIIKSVGSIAQKKAGNRDVRLHVFCPDFGIEDASLGDSIAVNGVCLTIVEIASSGFVADVSRETLALTTLGRSNVGSPVNLEPALTLSTPLGGHLLNGHVDGIGTIIGLREDGRSLVVQIEFPEHLAPYIAKKGSIAIDGTSLTVNEIKSTTMVLNIVPHTREQTIMPGYKTGTQVNLEVDLIARYLERLALFRSGTRDEHSLITKDSLARHGFL